MLKKSILFTLLALMLTFQACSKSEEKTQDANSMISTNEYILTGLDKKQYTVKKEGNGFVLKGAEGKVIIFDIFATWCPPCKASASHITSIQNKYKDNVVVLGVTIEDNIPNSKLEEFRKAYTANYALVNSQRNRPLADAIVRELKLGDRYPIPIMALYKDGKYINHYVGLIQEEFVESDIKKALEL